MTAQIILQLRLIAALWILHLWSFSDSDKSPTWMIFQLVWFPNSNNSQTLIIRRLQYISSTLIIRRLIICQPSQVLQKQQQKTQLRTIRYSNTIWYSRTISVICWVDYCSIFKNILYVDNFIRFQSH